MHASLNTLAASQTQREMQASPSNEELAVAVTNAQVFDDESPGQFGNILDLPLLCLEEERVILVDCNESEEEFLQFAEAALANVGDDAWLYVALDAEWEDPRPISLLQLALCTGPEASGKITIFLIDMLVELPDSVFSLVRRLLTGMSHPNHKVIAFAFREDKRRLRIANILPECLNSNGDDACSMWMDVQAFHWGLGAQPSLQAVVAAKLARRLDKTLQKSNWDSRPLSQSQRDYAALDASVLLLLLRAFPEAAIRREATLETGARRLKKKKASGSVLPSLLSLKEEQQRWRLYHASPQRLKQAAVSNGHLRYLLPAELNKLMRKMRGLGLDTLVAHEGASPQQLARSAVEGDRIIMTTSRKQQLPAEAISRQYSLRNTKLDDQLREIIDVFEVELHEDCLLGRCIQCNAWDWRRQTRDDVRDNPQVHTSTLEEYDEFWMCGGCHKIFWEGRMHSKAKHHYSMFLPGSQQAEQENGQAQPDAYNASSGY